MLVLFGFDLPGFGGLQCQKQSLEWFCFCQRSRCSCSCVCFASFWTAAIVCCCSEAGLPLIICCITYSMNIQYIGLHRLNFFGLCHICIVYLALLPIYLLDGPCGHSCLFGCTYSYSFNFLRAERVCEAAPLGSMLSLKTFLSVFTCVRVLVVTWSSRPQDFDGGP